MNPFHTVPIRQVGYINCRQKHVSLHRMQASQRDCGQKCISSDRMLVAGNRLRMDRTLQVGSSDAQLYFISNLLWSGVARRSEGALTHEESTQSMLEHDIQKGLIYSRTTPKALKEILNGILKQLLVHLTCRNCYSKQT